MPALTLAFLFFVLARPTIDHSAHTHYYPFSLHGFISAKTTLGFVTDWKVMNANAPGVTPGLIEETLQKNINEMGEGPEELKIWRLGSDPGF